MAVDIENFPTSETAKRMLDRVSPIYDKSYVGKWLFEVMGLELDDAKAIAASLRQQCFLEQCTWAIRYWEEMYGITPDESLDLETRRANCKAKRIRGRPLPPAALEKILEDLTGREVSVEEDNGNYRFIVNFGEGEDELDFDAIINKINTVKPSHLSYLFNLPRSAEMTLYYGTGIHEVRRVAFTECESSGIEYTEILADESGDVLTDESGNVFVI